MNNTPRILNDWTPETTALLDRLIAAGFTPTSGNNGEDKFKFDPAQKAAFVENLIACDEARVYLLAPDGKKVWIYLVLGNEPGVIASDYLCHDALDPVLDAHYEEWSGKTQPTKTSA